MMGNCISVPGVVKAVTLICYATAPTSDLPFLQLNSLFTLANVGYVMLVSEQICTGELEANLAKTRLCCLLQ